MKRGWWRAGLALLLLTLAGLGYRAWTPAPTLRQPPGWPAPHYRYDDNPLSRAGFKLGRQLFYEPRLSRDGSVSCGSCHQQFAAFAHLDHRLSHGIGGLNGSRNAPGLFNLAWQPELMWDGAVSHLELQPVAPLSNPVEMDSSLALAVERLRALPEYPPLFAAAFGTPEVDSQRLLRALAQFTGTLVSADSGYDQSQRGERKASAEEQAGLLVFREHCSGCHREPLFTDYSYRNNGLDAEPKDLGRAVVSGRAEDRGRFRVPSLRNVALTAPYMHDGRYQSLEQVLDHYAVGIQPAANLDPALAGGIALSGEQRRVLLSFLDSLSDERFVHDGGYAEPR